MTSARLKPDSDLPLDLSTKPRGFIDNTDSDALRRTSSSSIEILHLLTKDGRHNHTINNNIPVTNKRYPCLDCGIGFTSSLTLEAHQKGYCSKKPVDGETSETLLTLQPPQRLLVSTKRPSITTTFTYTPPIHTLEKPSSSPGPVRKQRRSMKSTAPPSMAEMGMANQLDSPKTGNFCFQCPFRANTLRGLRSHVTKCHSNSKDGNVCGNGKLTGKDQGVHVKRAASGRSSVIVAPKRPKIDGVCSAVSGGLAEKKKHCKYCDISFKYLSTFLAHRKYYCSVNKLDGSVVKDGAPAVAAKI